MSWFVLGIFLPVRHICIFTVTIMSYVVSLYYPFLSLLLAIHSFSCELNHMRSNLQACGEKITMWGHVQYMDAMEQIEKHHWKMHTEP